MGLGPKDDGYIVQIELSALSDQNHAPKQIVSRYIGRFAGFTCG